MKPTQVTSALTIPTPAVSAIVSLTTTQITLTISTMSCAITAKDELLTTQRPIEQQNARMPLELSKVFEDAVKRLFHVDRSAERTALGQRSGPAKVRPLPLTVQPSPVGTRSDPSGATFATANEIVGEGAIPAELEPVGAYEGKRDWLKVFQEDVAQQVERVSLRLSITANKGTFSSASCSPSPRPRRNAPGGKVMDKQKAWLTKEKE